ncbi:MAG TPA: hypothetical protein VFI65_13905 [Streptosporangiaceae bacterium]|nr:hypothetical protein [Streptosporangiaceae bacterium]
MLNKAKVHLVGMAVITALAVPASLLSADVPAGASTTACGSSCTSPTVQSVGTGQALAVSGTSIVMSTANTTSSTEDWTPEQLGDVANAITAGILAPKLNLLYSTDQLIELQYAPNGVPSDQCLANNWTGTTSLGGAAAWNSPTLTVVLAQCGITAASLWIVDASNEANGYVDLINAGYESSYSYLAQNNSAAENLTSPFAEPAVLTVNSSGHVVLAMLSELGGVVSPTQMWAAWSAPAQAFLRTAVQTQHRKLAARFG